MPHPHNKRQHNTVCGRGPELTLTAGGRAGEGASTGLTEALVAKGFETARLKTGTPARVDSRSCDFSGLQEQPGDATVRWFSFDPQVWLLIWGPCSGLVLKLAYTMVEHADCLEKVAGADRRSDQSVTCTTRSPCGVLLVAAQAKGG